MAKRTSIRRAIRTIAWPSWSFRCRDLGRVLSTINRISSDDDLVADNLLDYWSKRLEVEPQRHLDGLVSNGGLDCVAARTGRRQRAQAAARAIGCRRRVAARARVRDEYPSGIRRRNQKRALWVAAVWNRPVGARVGEHFSHGVRLDSTGDVSVSRPAVHIRRWGAADPAWIHVIGGMHSHSRALVGRLLQRDVEVKAAPEVDDPKGQEQDHGCDQRELGQFMSSEILMSPSRHELSGGGAAIEPVCAEPPGYV